MSEELDLEPDQIETLARIIDDLKTERAQAAVDERRSVGLIADAVAGDAFGRDKVKEALDLRVKGAERLRDANFRRSSRRIRCSRRSRERSFRICCARARSRSDATSLSCCAVAANVHAAAARFTNGSAEPRPRSPSRVGDLTGPRSVRKTVVSMRSHATITTTTTTRFGGPAVVRAS